MINVKNLEGLQNYSIYASNINDAFMKHLTSTEKFLSAVVMLISVYFIFIISRKL